MLRVHAVVVLVQCVLLYCSLSAASTASSDGINLAPRAHTGVSIWAAGSTEKIQNRQRSPLPHSQVWDDDTRTVRLSGVRGEHMPFHLVVSVTDMPVTNVTLEIGDLRQDTHLLAASNVRPYLEHFVTVYAPTGRHGRKGRWPDPLVPLTRPFDVSASGNGQDARHQPLWIDIRVPRDQTPGT